MGKAYSLDLRQKAVAAVKAGAPQKQTAEFLEIGVATLRRWQAKEQAGESLAPELGKPGPRGQFEDAASLERLHIQLQADPDGRLRDHCRRWQDATGRAVSVTTMHRAWTRLGWTHKKSVSPPASATRSNA